MDEAQVTVGVRTTTAPSTVVDGAVIELRRIGHTLVPGGRVREDIGPDDSPTVHGSALVIW